MSQSIAYKRLTRRIWGIKGAGSVFRRPLNGVFYACNAVGEIVGQFDNHLDALIEASKWTLERSMVGQHQIVEIMEADDA